jgi:hypothetical protein
MAGSLVRCSKCRPGGLRYGSAYGVDIRDPPLPCRALLSNTTAGTRVLFLITYPTLRGGKPLAFRMIKHLFVAAAGSLGKELP